MLVNVLAARGCVLAVLTLTIAKPGSGAKRGGRNPARDG